MTTTGAQHPGMTLSADEPKRSPVAIGAGIVGLTFLLVGILGFIPGITTDLDQIEWVGHESGAELLGLFQVSVLHNLVHLSFGVVGLLCARRTDLARGYLIGGGILYLVLFAYGMVVDRGSDANFVPLNEADDWLHLGLGIGMIALGLVLPRLVTPRDHRQAPRTAA